MSARQNRFTFPAIRWRNDEPLSVDERRQIVSLFTELEIAGAALCVNAAIIVVALYGQISNSLLFFGIALFVSEVIVKLLISKRYLSLPCDSQCKPHWRYVVDIGAIYSGLFYGFCILLVFTPLPLPSAVLLVACFCGNVLLMSQMSGFYSRVWYFTVVPMFLPIILTLLFTRQPLYMLLVAVCLASLGVSSYYGARTVRQSAKLRAAHSRNEKLLRKVELEKLLVEKSHKLASDAIVEKNRFIAAASHDLRQPLHSLGLWHQTLNTRCNDDISQQVLDEMENSIESMRRQFNSLLDVSQLDAGVVEIDNRNLSLALLFADVHAEYKALAKAKGLALSMVDNNVVVFSDGLLLERVLRNLVSNAIEYTSEGTVTVAAETKANSVLISVEDTGVGIPAHEVENIFTEYYQIQDSSDLSSRGLGLGLSIVQRTCSLLGIALKVESDAGTGTRFEIELQAGTDELKPRISTVSKASEVDISDVKVLIVDDDPSILTAMELALHQRNCIVYCASSFAETIELVTGLDSGKIDIILCDYGLGAKEPTGIELCRELLDQAGLEIPVLIVTGDTSKNRLQEISQSGFQLIHKPVSAKNLCFAIADNLDQVQTA